MSEMVFPEASSLATEAALAAKCAPSEIRKKGNYVQQRQRPTRQSFARSTYAPSAVMTTTRVPATI